MLVAACSPPPACPFGGVQTDRVARGAEHRHRVLRRRLPRDALRRAGPAAAHDDDGPHPHADRARALRRGRGGDGPHARSSCSTATRTSPAGRARGCESGSTRDPRRRRARRAGPRRPRRAPGAHPRRRQLPQPRLPHLQPLAHAPLRLPDQPTRDVDGVPPGGGPRPPRPGTARATPAATATRTTSPRATSAVPAARSTRAPTAAASSIAAASACAATASRSPAPGRSRTAAGGSWRPTSATARGWRWSTQGRPGHYDVESAAVHETGHSIGLGHVSASRYLTMYHQLCAGCTFARTLGRGDVLGLRKLY